MKRLYHTRKQWESRLNDIGMPSNEHPSCGGRVPWSYLTKYGTWLRKNDLASFEAGYQKWIRP